MKWLKFLGEMTIVASLVVLSACTKSAQKPESPEAALEQYVTTAFSAKAEARDKLLQLSVGQAKEWLSSMSPEDFKKQFVENSMVFVSMKTKDLRQEQSGDVSLVYELSFKDGKTPNAAAYTNKKIAYLTRDKDDGNRWKIRETKNVKSVVERKDALEILTPETTDKNPAPESK